MEAVPELQSAEGQGPQDIGSNTPEAQAGPQPTATPVPLQLPPNRSPAGELSPQEQAELLEAKQQANKQNTPNQLSPQEQAELLEAKQQADQKQGPPEPTDLTDSSAFHGLVKDAAGRYRIQEPGGQLRELTHFEKQGAHYMAKGLRIGGPVLGAIAGTGLGTMAAGATGGAMAPAILPLESAGSVLGGEAVHGTASLLEEAAGEKPEERTMLTRSGEALGPVFGRFVGAIGQKFGGSALPGIAKTESADLVQKGTQTLAAEAATRQATAKETGIPLTSEQVQPEGPKPSKATLAAVGQEQKIVDSFGKLKDDISPTLSADQAKDFSTKGFFENVRQDSEKKIGALKGKAYQYSKNEDIPDLGSKVEDAVKGTMEKRFADNPSYTENWLDQRESGDASLRDLDRLVTTTGEKAKFGAIDRGENEKIAGELYHNIKDVRDQALEDVFTKNGDTESLKALQQERKNYSQNREKWDKFSDKFANDPSMLGAARIIAKKNNFGELRDFMSMVPEEQQGQFRRLMADEIIGKPTRGNIDAAGMEKRLNGLDYKNRDLIFGDAQPELHKLINVAKLVESNPAAANQRAAKTLVEKLMKSPREYIKSGANALHSAWMLKSPIAGAAGTAAAKGAQEELE